MELKRAPNPLLLHCFRTNYCNQVKKSPLSCFAFEKCMNLNNFILCLGSKKESVLFQALLGGEWEKLEAESLARHLGTTVHALPRGGCPLAAEQFASDMQL